MNLEQIRKQIDKLDDEILELLLQRIKYSKMIAEIKFNDKLPIFDAKREDEIFYRLKSNSDENYKYVVDIFFEILSASKHIQQDLINKKVRKNNGQTQL